MKTLPTRRTKTQSFFQFFEQCSHSNTKENMISKQKMNYDFISCHQKQEAKSSFSICLISSILFQKGTKEFGLIGFLNFAQNRALRQISQYFLKNNLNEIHNPFFNQVSPGLRVGSINLAIPGNHRFRHTPWCSR